MSTTTPSGPKPPTSPGTGAATPPKLGGTPSTPAPKIPAKPLGGGGPIGKGTVAAKHTGRVLQVIGPVVDVEFDDQLPEINTALTISNPRISDKPNNLTVEIALHLGENAVRTVAMDTTDGLVRGMEVLDTGAPITMPSLPTPRT